MSDRRRFFRHLLGEVRSLTEEASGIVQCPLRGLRDWGDDELRAVRPMVRPGVAIELHEATVMARLSAEAAPVALFAVDSVECRLFNEFNGETTLAEVAASWHGSDDPQASWLQVRALFLELADRAVCCPAEPSRS